MSSLFFRRWSQEVKFQYGVLRSIFDWTIIVYLLLPGLVIFSFIYRSWWLEQPGWIEDLPLLILFYSGYFAAWMGNYRTFILEADKVFLIKHPALFIGLKKAGYIYSLVLQSSGIGLLSILLMPFFRYTYHLAYDQILAFFITFSLLKWLIMAIKYRLGSINGKLARGLACFFSFIAGSWMIQLIFLAWEAKMYPAIILAGILFSGISFILHIPLLSKIASFEEEQLLEKRERNKYIHFIFTFSPEVEKIPVTSRTRPFLFKKSKRLYKDRTPENGFLELFLKIFLRNSQHWSSFLQLVSVTAAALMFVPPYWLKGAVLAGFIIMLHSWLSMIWEKVTLSHPLTKRFREDHDFLLAKRKAIRYLLLTGISMALVPFCFRLLLFS